MFAASKTQNFSEATSLYDGLVERRVIVINDFIAYINACVVVKNALEANRAYAKAIELKQSNPLFYIAFIQALIKLQASHQDICRVVNTIETETPETNKKLYNEVFYELMDSSFALLSYIYHKLPSNMLDLAICHTHMNIAADKHRFNEVEIVYNYLRQNNRNTPQSDQIYNDAYTAFMNLPDQG